MHRILQSCAHLLPLVDLARDPLVHALRELHKFLDSLIDHLNVVDRRLDLLFVLLLSELRVFDCLVDLPLLVLDCLLLELLLREHFLVDLVRHGDQPRVQVTDLRIRSRQLLLLRHVILLKEQYLLIKLYLHLLLEATHKLNHLDLLGVQQLYGLLMLEIEALEVLPDRFHILLMRVDPIVEVLQHFCIQFPLFI